MWCWAWQAWLSPNRGSFPMAWAADPYLGTLFPDLWNFYISNTTKNDTFVDGVDGAGEACHAARLCVCCVLCAVCCALCAALLRWQCFCCWLSAWCTPPTATMSCGNTSPLSDVVLRAWSKASAPTFLTRACCNVQGYVFIDSLDKPAGYEQRAGAIMAKLGPNVVDVGVASNKWNATTLTEIQTYVTNARAAAGGKHVPTAVLNACGTEYGQPINAWLPDGTPVINSVCVGPANDTSVRDTCRAAGVLGLLCSVLTDSMVF